MSEKKEGIGNLSRRQFLKDAGLVVGGTAVSSVFLLSACGKEIEVTKTVTTTAPGTTVTKYVCPFDNQEFSTLAALKTHIEASHAGALAQTITMTINGKQHKLTYGDSVMPGEPGSYDVYPWHTLAWTLREKLNLTGTKIGCDAGECGSCTVLIEGKPVQSCMVLTAECDGKNIETIESLFDPVKQQLHPIQRAFVENNGLQCGFCTPAMMMTAKALLAKKPNPTEEEVKEAISAILCRCTGYVQIVESIQQAAALMR
jgi:aerobic-type carbon monoxide dehydrogenase small subunit (CoxS/CutS family)